MGEMLLELIERTKDSIRPFEHSQSTSYQYQLAWKGLSKYFIEHNQILFSKQLAERYVHESEAKLDAGVIRKWRYKLIRLTVQMLIECYEEGYITWKHHKYGQPRLHVSAYHLLHKEFIDCLNKEGKSNRTIQCYEIVSRQFLEYLEQKKIVAIYGVSLTDVSAFSPFISKQYKPASMGTVLTALRAFLRFVESKQLTKCCLSNAIPSSAARRTTIVPTITPEEEQKLLTSVDCTTTLGKRNHAMLLLALRTGIRSIDIINLKLGDINWKSNIIAIVQEKTDTPLVLPLLTDVGNAIADYIINGRPCSQEPYLFLRTQAPHQKLSGRSVCYAISCKMMKDAGIRQSKGARRGFHCLRHYVAARLLSVETPLPIISSILGHRDKNSTKIYLSTDLAHLGTCALSLKGIEVTKEELL